MRLIYVCTALASEDISAMEIGTLLQSGIPESRDIGVIVSRMEGVSEDRYRTILRSERENQFYLFLAELRICRVRISTSPSFAVDALRIPSESDVNAIVRNLQTTLEGLGGKTKQDVRAVVSYFLQLYSYEKIEFVRRLAETNYLLNNLENLKKRFMSPYDTVYTNMQRTRREEVNAVYRQIFQAPRPVNEADARYPFDLHNFEFNFEKVLLVFNRHVPLILTVPQGATSDSILHFVFSDKTAMRRIGDARRLLRFLLFRLYTKYARQITDYAKFLGNPYPPAIPYRQRRLVDAIRLVQRERRRALQLSKKFVFSYGSKGTQFYIHVHDPEGRASLHLRDGKPFANMRQALPFYTQVIRSFDRVPRFFYSGVLRNVVLFDRKNNVVAGDTIVAGRVTADGCEMQLLDLKRTVFMVYETILHESGHVFDWKFNRQLSEKLSHITSLRYSPQIQRCLRQGLQTFSDPRGRFTYSNLDIERLSIVSERLLSQSIVFNFEGELKKLSQEEMRFLREMQDSGPLLERRAKDHDDFQYTMAGDDSAEFTSYLAAMNTIEEAAELFRQYADPTKRTALVLECKNNAVKREKLDLALGVLTMSDAGIGETPRAVRERLTIVNRWRKLHVNGFSASSKRYCVVLVTDIHESSFDAFDEANTFVQKKTRDGHCVSFFLLIQDGELPTLEVLQRGLSSTGSRSQQRATVVMFGVSQEKWSDAQDELWYLLAANDWDLDGRRSLGRSDHAFPPILANKCR